MSYKHVIHPFTKQWALRVYESLISWFIALIYLTLVRFTLEWTVWLHDVDVSFYIQSANGMNNIIIVLIYETIKVGVIAASLISACKIKELIFYHLAELLVSAIFWDQFFVWPQASEQMLKKSCRTKIHIAGKLVLKEPVILGSHVW